MTPSGGVGAATEHGSSGAWARAVEEGRGILLEKNQERSMRRDLEGGGWGGRWCHVGKTNLAVTKDGYII